MRPYGGFWIRVVAYIIDAILLNLVNVALGAMFGVGTGIAFGRASPFALGGGGLASGLPLLVYGLTLAINWLYFALMESSARQATVGKMALGLLVTDEHGDRIGFGRATGRYFGKIVSSITLGIGFLMVGWTDRKRGLHDIMAGTLVYKSRSPELARSSAAIFE